MRRQKRPNYEIAAAILIGLPLGFLIQGFMEDIRYAVIVVLIPAITSWVDLPWAIIGMAGGLSFYLWEVSEGAKFRLLHAVLHTGVGSFFGLLGAKLSGGFGFNGQIQTAASGIGGGMGPRAVNKLEKLVTK